MRDIQTVNEWIDVKDVVATAQLLVQRGAGTPDAAANGDAA